MKTIAGIAGALLVAGTAIAQTGGAQTSAGPGRITCTSVKACTLGLGTPAKLRYQIDASGLSEADKTRLTKECTVRAKTPCVATVEGTEMGDPMKVKAAKITFHN